jgi:hypothetical protein
MLLVREIMYCKPGKVRPLVEKFQAMSKLMQKHGMGKMRILTDVSAERYWTLVSEMEVPSLKAFEEMFEGPGQSEEAMKEFDGLMKGYHDLVESGRREIYKIEANALGRRRITRRRPCGCPISVVLRSLERLSSGT